MRISLIAFIPPKVIATSTFILHLRYDSLKDLPILRFHKKRRFLSIYQYYNRAAKDIISFRDQNGCNTFTW